VAIDLVHVNAGANRHSKLLIGNLSSDIKVKTKSYLSIHLNGLIND
jgi:hypothetical protein